MANHTRFAIGGPARLLAETSDSQAFQQALSLLQTSETPHEIIGGGTNLIVADSGFDGIILKYAADAITADGNLVKVQSGAILQHLVDFTVARGLRGYETLSGIPGWVGGAIYGNAGAYGHSISERVHSVTFTDGRETRRFTNAQCEFHYRESIFKRNKQWVILSAEMLMLPGDQAELAKTADGILDERNKKFPPTMKCAGSIFKNLLLANLGNVDVPEKVVREGKVPAAYFLEQAGAKGMREGGIEVASYHANLIYNAGGGTARDLCTLITELKQRVRQRFSIELEEEVQYVGDFPTQ